MGLFETQGFNETRSEFGPSGSSIRNLDEALTAIDRDPSFNPDFDAKRIDTSYAAPDRFERNWS